MRATSTAIWNSIPPYTFNQIRRRSSQTRRPPYRGAPAPSHRGGSRHRPAGRPAPGPARSSISAFSISEPVEVAEQVEGDDRRRDQQEIRPGRFCRYCPPSRARTQTTRQDLVRGEVRPAAERRTPVPPAASLPFHAVETEGEVSRARPRGPARPPCRPGRRRRPPDPTRKASTVTWFGVTTRSRSGQPDQVNGRGSTRRTVHHESRCLVGDRAKARSRSPYLS